MSKLLSEVQAMQNPALGAAVTWTFCQAYTKKSGEPCPLPLAFIVLPIVLHERTRERVSSTQARSGLRKFQEKFTNEGDLLLALNERALSMRQLSLASVRLALATGLLALDPVTGKLWPSEAALPRPVPDSVADLSAAAGKLGEWCSELTLHEVSAILRLEF